MTELPSKYLLHRWTINVRYKGDENIWQSSPPGNDVAPFIMLKIRETGLKAIDLGLSSVERSRPCLEGLQKLVQELEGIEVIVNSTVASNEEVTSTVVDCGLKIQDPPMSITIGRPLKKSRIVSAMEKALEKLNDQLKEKGKLRACGICKDLGHYRSTYPQLKK